MGRCPTGPGHGQTGVGLDISGGKDVVSSLRNITCGEHSRCGRAEFGGVETGQAGSAALRGAEGGQW